MPGQLDVSKIHEILFGDMGVEILFVAGEGIQRVVVEFALVLVVVHDSYIFIFENKQNYSSFGVGFSYGFWGWEVW